MITPRDIALAAMSEAGKALVDASNAQMTADAAQAAVDATDASAALAAANAAQVDATQALSDAGTAQSSADAALPKAGGTMTGDIVLAGPPDTDLKAATKKYVDDTVLGGGLPLSGGAMTGNIILAGDPVFTLHPATKQYADAIDTKADSAQADATSGINNAATAQATADAALPKAGGTMTGYLTLPGPPNTDLKAATKKYVDDTAAAGDAAALPKTGGTLTGDLILPGPPNADLKAATKKYVDDTVLGGGLPLSGGTMTGNIVLAGDPTLALHPATKQYADAATGGWDRTIVGAGSPVEEIIVRGTGDQSVALQAAIDAAGSHIHIIFDTPEVDLYGIVISGKDFMRMSTTHGSTTIYLPVASYDVRRTTSAPRQMEILDCKIVEIEGRIIADGSKATGWTTPTIDTDSMRSGWYIFGSGDYVRINKFTNQNTYFNGLYVQSAHPPGTPGYDDVTITDLKSFDAPLYICGVRGRHRMVLVERVYAEDPNCKSIYHISSAHVTMSYTAEVGVPDDYADHVRFRDIHSRYSNSNVQIQQGCWNGVMEDIVIEDRGFDGNGDAVKDSLLRAGGAIDYNGGPASKPDFVLWYKHHFLKWINFQTRNSNYADNFESLWMGQAATQNVKAINCDLDSEVHGGGITPTRPSSTEGWSRHDMLENCIIRNTGIVYMDSLSVVKGCRFMCETVSDPVYTNSQHDDLLSSYGPLSAGVIVPEGGQVYDCDFYSRSLQLKAGANTGKDTLIENVRLWGESQIKTENGTEGTFTFKNVHFGDNSEINTAYRVSTNPLILNLINCTGNINTTIGGLGPGAPAPIINTYAAVDATDSETVLTPTGTTQTMVCDTRRDQTLNLASATGTVTFTMTVPTNIGSGTIIIKQHASTTRDLTWATSSGSIVWLSAGGEPDWSLDATSSRRIVTWRWDGTDMFLAATPVGS